MEGNRQTRCSADGTWSSEPVTCTTIPAGINFSLNKFWIIALDSSGADAESSPAGGIIGGAIAGLLALMFLLALILFGIYIVKRRNKSKKYYPMPNDG